MSSLFGMIYTGVTGINASQIALDVTGQNIANMKNENYSRQLVSLNTVKPQQTSVGQMGRGVRVEQIERAYDELLAKSVRNEESAYSYYSSLQSYIDEAMLYFDELEAGSGLGDALQDYFDAWQNLANSATDGSDSPTIKRTTLIETATTLTKKLNEGYTHFEDLKKNAVYNVENIINDINLKSENIADLNKQIALAEFMGQPANDLRDSRDALVDSIAQYATVATYERENGQIALMVGGQLIVDGVNPHLLEQKVNEDTGELEIYWKSGNAKGKPVELTGNLSFGSLGANLKLHNELLENYMTSLDDIAQVVITETNLIHASGQGLERYSNITSSNGVLNPRYEFNTELGQMPYEIKDGTFRINFYSETVDPDGKTITKEHNIDVEVRATDNIHAVIDRINLYAGGMVRASISENNGISLNASLGLTMSFGEDTSNFLVAAGLNCFFTGTSAKDISVEETIVNNPALIATAKSSAEGDNENAKKLALLGNKVLDSTGGYTISGFYGIFIGNMTSEKSQADIFAATKKMSSEQLGERLQSIRGVSENDELLNMSLFQRVFEANSRYINVVDEMLNTIVNGLGTAGR